LYPVRVTYHFMIHYESEGRNLIVIQLVHSCSRLRVPNEEELLLLLVVLSELLMVQHLGNGILWSYFL